MAEENIDGYTGLAIYELNIHKVNKKKGGEKTSFRKEQSWGV